MDGWMDRETARDKADGCTKIPYMRLRGLPWGWRRLSSSGLCTARQQCPVAESQDFEWRGYIFTA
eukprot:scaffold33773_cov22-Prasinocladus_malaysianus.AAC.1